MKISAVVVIIIAGFSVANSSSKKKQTFRWPVMGTVAQVTVRGNGADIVACETNTLPGVRNTFARLDNLLSAWNKDSELCRLSAAECTNWLQEASPIVRPCYAAALKLYNESSHAFNPYIGAKLKSLGISKGGSYSNFDLGAIAKGFAVDVAASEMPPNTDLIIDLGGNLRVVGNGKWKTGIRNPFDKSAPYIGIITLTNGESVATSGNYERFIERSGKRYSHILDGRTGSHTSGIAAVTVVTPSDYGAVLADGLSTTLFILGPEDGSRFLTALYPRALALWVPDTPESPSVIVTSSMNERIANTIYPTSVLK